MDERRKLTTTPEEHQLITKLYGPDPHESKPLSGASDGGERDSAFVFDVEDLAFIGLYDDSADERLQ